MKSKSVSQAVGMAGLDENMRDYQKLKEAHDMEVEATARLRERYAKEVGEQNADKRLRIQGYDPGLLK